MKVCLVNAPYDGPIAGIWSDVFPPLTVLSLAAYLRQERPEHKISIVDGLRIGMKKALALAISEKPDVLAVSFVTFNASSAYRFINAFKKAMPDCTVIVGGSHVTSLEQDAFQKCRTDFAIHGEGEVTLVELLDQIQGDGDYSSVEGILFRDGETVSRTENRALIEDINTLPFPARDLIDLDDYSGLYICKRKRNTHIISGRGCVNHCLFCGRIVWKRQQPTIRLRNPEHIVAELLELRDRYKVEEFFDMGDEFNSSDQWAISVCEAIVNAKLNMPWQAFSRATPVTDGMAKAMKRAGCWLVHLGIESGNQRTLDGIRKNITLEQARKAAATYQRNGISVVALFMLFHAWEEDGHLAYEGVEQSRNTLRFARKMLKDKLADSITCSPALPYPGSLLYGVANRHQLIPKQRFEDWGVWDHSWGSVMETPGVSNFARWRVKLSGIWTQGWALIFSGHLNFSKAIWGRGLGVFKMIAGAVMEKMPKIAGSGRKGITP